MTDRDRLAADLQAADDEWNARDIMADDLIRWRDRIADRLIALGWTRLDEERPSVLRKELDGLDVVEVIDEERPVTAALDALAEKVAGLTDTPGWRTTFVSLAAVLAAIEDAKRAAKAAGRREDTDAD